MSILIALVVLYILYQLSDIFIMGALTGLLYFDNKRNDAALAKIKARQCKINL